MVIEILFLLDISSPRQQWSQFGDLSLAQLTLRNHTVSDSHPLVYKMTYLNPRPYRGGVGATPPKVFRG